MNQFQAMQSAKVTDEANARFGQVGAVVAQGVNDKGEPGGDLVGLRLESGTGDGTQVVVYFEAGALEGL